MEAVAPRAIAVTASAVPSSTGKESGKKNVQPVSVPFLRPVSTLAASLLATAPALALNYDELVKKAADTASSSSMPELPALDLDAVSANPLALAGVLAAVAVPLLASRAFAGPTSSGSVSAVQAFEKLSDPEQGAQLLDIREPADVKAEGSPSLRALRKSPLKVAYAANDDSFVEKVLAKCKNAEETTLYILDSRGQSAASVAKLLANSGFKGAYAIKGGAENGWRTKDLPWSEPAKSLSLNLDGLKSVVKGGEGSLEVPSVAPGTVAAVAAAVGAGVLVLSEVETTLQLLGIVAVGQLVYQKLLYAEDRKNTLQEIRNFWDKEIAPKDFVKEVKDAGSALLLKDDEVQAVVDTGTVVLEKELNVEAITPGILAEKAKEKIVEEAEKLGVNVPDVGKVQSDIQSNVESVTSGLKSSAAGLQSNVDAAIENLESGAEDLKTNADKVASEVESKAEEVGVDLKSGAEDLKTNAEEATSKAGSKAEEVGDDLKSGAEDLKTNAKEATSKAESKAEEVGSDLKSGADEATSKVGSKAEEVGSDLKSGADNATSKAQSKAEEVGSDLKSGAEETKSSNGSTAPVDKKPAEKGVSPFFASDATPASDPKPAAPTSKDEIRESALSAFEGDEPLSKDGLVDDTPKKKFSVSSSADTSS